VRNKGKYSQVEKVQKGGVRSKGEISKQHEKGVRKKERYE